MIIDLENPMISYAKKGIDFPYARMFETVFDDYIREYKNAKLEGLTDIDQAICLSRLVKKLYVNGVPSTEFFAEQRAMLSPSLTDCERAHAFVEIISQDLFAFYDMNKADIKGNMKVPDNIYYILKDNGERDFVTSPIPTKMQKMFSSKFKYLIDCYGVYEKLIEKLDSGDLSTKYVKE